MTKEEYVENERIKTEWFESINQTLIDHPDTFIVEKEGHEFYVNKTRKFIMQKCKCKRTKDFMLHMRLMWEIYPHDEMCKKD